MSSRYLRFSNSDGKEWIVPLKRMSVGLQLYQPSSIRGRLLSWLLSYFYRVPQVRSAVRGEVVDFDLSDDLKCTLVELLGFSDFEFSIFEGTPSEHQKRTIQISKGDNILCYCKVSQNQDVAALFWHEAQILSELQAAGVRGIPIPLFCGVLRDGSTLFVQSTRKSKCSKLEHRFTDKHRAFLENLYSKTARCCKFIESDICRSISRVEGEYSALISSITSFYGDREYLFSVYHGDFTPWNTFIERGELFVFDFEYAARSFPPYMDRFHFFTQVAIFEERLDGEAIYNKFMESELHEQRIGYALYLLHSIAHYQSRGESAARLVNIWREVIHRL